MPAHHALLIGIDAYQGGTSLSGCVNDIDAIQRILLGKVGIAPERVQRLVSPRYDATPDSVIPAQPATLANIRNAFARLAEVAPGDRVFIYYSGHGTRCRIVEDGVSFAREALLPNDNLVWNEQRFLFDWEINGLIAQVADRTPAVTAVLDCCCSAGATRGDFELPTAKARFCPTPNQVVLPPGERIPSGIGARGVASGAASRLHSCQIIAACHDDERARESPDTGGVSHGELTRALLNVLTNVPTEAIPELRWGRIWREVVAAVTKQNPAQHPWMSGGFARRVFGGPPEVGDTGYGVSRDGDAYLVSVGTLSAVTENARLAVYGSEPAEFPPAGSPEDVSAHQGRLLRVASATRTTATAVAETAPFDLPPGARARLVAAGQAAKINVWLSPADASLASAVAASPLLALSATKTSADVQLLQRRDSAWAVVDDVFGTGEDAAPQLVIIPSALRARAVAILKHYHAYTLPLRLAKACQDLPHALRIVVRDCNQMGAITKAQAQNPSHLPERLSGDRAPYDIVAGDEHDSGDKICIEVHNHAAYDLFVTLISCFQSGRVKIVSEIEIGREAMHAFWQNDDLAEPFRFWLPAGVDVGVDRLIAIGTTNRNASLAHLALNRSFAEILYPARDLTAPRHLPTPELWTATTTAFHLKRGAQ